MMQGIVLNGAGQLGDGTNTDRLTPTLIGTGWATIAAGERHTIEFRGRDT